MRRHLPQAVELRHLLHARPQVGDAEEPTAQAWTDWLGLGEGRRVARTGRLVEVVAGTGAAVVLRAELDGLPIEETAAVPWRSTSGVMHACGHDVHLAALACVSRAAASLDLPRPLLALLQPREEGIDSGARDVLAEGALDGVAAVVGAHVQPRLPAGLVAVTPGAVNAATDEFWVTVRGRGGHSGYPHTVDDSVLALASVVVALQQLGAGRVDPTVGVACMVTRLEAGTANNVVPGSATASGTLRTMSVTDRTRAVAALEQIAGGVAAAHGCAAEVRVETAEPVLVNDPSLAAAAAQVLGELGHEVDRTWRSFGSDDFSYYCEQVPGLMLFVGVGDAGGGLHDPVFAPDDDYVALVADALVAGYCAALDQTDQTDQTGQAG